MEGKIEVYLNTLHYELHLAARVGDYEKFTTLFEKSQIQVNARSTSGCTGETFLYTVTVNDSQYEDSGIVFNRKKIARYLLEKGADMGQKSCDISVETYRVHGKCSRSKKRLFESFFWLHSFGQ